MKWNRMLEAPAANNENQVYSKSNMDPILAEPMDPIPVEPDYNFDLDMPATSGNESSTLWISGRCVMSDSSCFT